MLITFSIVGSLQKYILHCDSLTSPNAFPLFLLATMLLRSFDPPIPHSTFDDLNATTPWGCRTISGGCRSGPSIRSSASLFLLLVSLSCLFTSLFCLFSITRLVNIAIRITLCPMGYCIDHYCSLNPKCVRVSKSLCE
jgi:hypothetical protein